MSYDAINHSRVERKDYLPSFTPNGLIVHLYIVFTVIIVFVIFFAIVIVMFAKSFHLPCSNCYALHHGVFYHLKLKQVNVL